MEGMAVLTLVAHNATDTLVLDSRSLEIKSVVTMPANATGRSPVPDDATQLKFELSELSEALGQSLTISLPEQLAAGQSEKVSVHFVMGEKSTAAQFLTPAQTGSLLVC